jgi:hypothetical protein
LANSIAELGSRPMMEPGRQPVIDLLFRRARVPPSQVLAHQGDPGLEEVEGHAERLGDIAMVRGHVMSLTRQAPAASLVGGRMRGPASMRAVRPATLT